MAIAVTNIGTKNSVSTGSSLVMTGVTVPAGALIVVGTGESGSGSTYTGTGSLTDSAGNTYSRVSNYFNNSTANGVGVVWYCLNALALSSQSITLTKNLSSSNDAVMSAFYATGIGTLDSTVTASATGSTNSPSLTSGTPSGANELLVAFAIAAGPASTMTYTQDSTNGWATPPNFITADDGLNGSAAVGGGTQVNSTANARTFHPTTVGYTLGTATFILGFKATVQHVRKPLRTYLRR